MAKLVTTNQSDFSGTYGTEAEPITFASNIVSTTIISGLTAIGTGQMFKQLGKKEEKEKLLSEEPKPEAEKPADSDDNTEK